MENNIYLTILYDYYKELLTDKQKLYFENYYFNNLSLGEIKDNLGVSRNAIHKELKNIELKLNMYEEKLNLYKRDKKLLSLVEKIDNINLKDEIKKILDLEEL